MKKIIFSPFKWEKTGRPIKGNANGHPTMYDYIKEGYEIITL